MFLILPYLFSVRGLLTNKLKYIGHRENYFELFMAREKQHKKKTKLGLESTSPCVCLYIGLGVRTTGPQGSLPVLLRASKLGLPHAPILFCPFESSPWCHHYFNLFIWFTQRQHSLLSDSVFYYLWTDLYKYQGWERIWISRQSFFFPTYCFIYCHKRRTLHGLIKEACWGLYRECSSKWP